MQLPDEAIAYKYQNAAGPQRRGVDAGRRAAAAALPAAGPAARADAARHAGAQPGRHRARAAASARRRCSRSTPASSTCRRSCSTSTAARATPAPRPRPQDRRPTCATRSTASSFSASAARTWGRVPCSRRCVSSYHNELPAKDRPGAPRIYFEGNNVDNDALQELLEMLQITCVDPDLREERWGVGRHQQVGRHAGDRRRLSRHPPRAGRVLRHPLAARRKNLIVPITGADGQAARPVPGGRLSRGEHPDHPRQRRRPVFRLHAGRPVAGRGDGPRRPRPAARGGGDDPPLPRGAVRAQPGAAIRRRQLSDVHASARSRSACCRSGRRSWKRSGCGTISCWRRAWASRARARRR